MRPCSRALRITACVVVALFPFALAMAEHTGDVAVGRSGIDQLRYKPYTEAHPSFEPADDVGLLTFIEALNSYRTVDPGFDANFDAEPEVDFYPLESGAAIYLRAWADLEPAFHVEYQGQVIDEAGEEIALGSSILHRHVRFEVDGDDPEFDPLRTLWYGTFVLVDQGSTGYTESQPFTLRFSIVECEAGDVNGDGLADIHDINPFVSVLAGPEAASDEQRCAADVNRDGYVTIRDINPFVRLLAGG